METSREYYERVMSGYRETRGRRSLRKYCQDEGIDYQWRKHPLKCILYTYTLLPRLSRHVLDGRYSIDNNGVENVIRPLALGRKNYLFCGNHDAAVRAAIVYSLFASCKAHDVEIRAWLEDTLRRLPMEKDIKMLLPENGQPVTVQ